jgi:lactate dehydrogenase-like 2-hydroxyacid dehydrogenase
MGKIGYLIAKKAQVAFNMEIIYHDIIRKSADVEAEIKATFYPSLPKMLASSDCVVLATPSSPDRSKLISNSTLSHFKHGSRFINVARGSLVDEEALVEALESGKISAAMLDVHEQEPNVNEKLARMRNVTLTCHNAGGTLETHYGFEKQSMENIEAVLAGRDPISPVNLHLMQNSK